jgi:8-amino-7-oxononanoate synthase
MDLLDKLRAVLALAAQLDGGASRPFDTVIDDVLDPTEVTIGGRRTLVFGSNNYFGLTCHPEVTAAARAAIDRYGTGTTGSRVANGTFAIHRALEEEFARVFGKREAIVFTTGYQASLALVGALGGVEDFVLLDADSHASLYDAARLSGATVVGFRHNRPDHLRTQLARLPAGGRNRLVVVEGLYSIRGDVSPLAEIVQVCKESGAYLMVDEAHSFGAYGLRGLGWSEAEGVLADVDFVVGTFSKALGGVGGFVVSDHPELKGLRLLARAYIFTASSSPASIAGAHAALKVLTRDRSLADRLWRAVHRLRAGLDAIGYRIGATPSPIVPVTFGDRTRTIAMWRALLEAGLYVNLVLPPACPAEECLLRVSCSAAHTDAHVDRAVGIFERVGREMGVTSSVT